MVVGVSAQALDKSAAPSPLHAVQPQTIKLDLSKQRREIIDTCSRPWPAVQLRAGAPEPGKARLLGARRRKEIIHCILGTPYSGSARISAFVSWISRSVRSQFWGRETPPSYGS
jgi:hypothetical protein